MRRLTRRAATATVAGGHAVGGGGAGGHDVQGGGGDLRQGEDGLVDVTGGGGGDQRGQGGAVARVVEAGAVADEVDVVWVVGVRGVDVPAATAESKAAGIGHCKGSGGVKRPVERGDRGAEFRHCQASSRLEAQKTVLC